MARKKPEARDSAARRKPSPENDLAHSIFYLYVFEGISLEEMAEAAGLDAHTVDCYMVGQKPVSRHLVEQFCRAAGTTLPRVELALPIIYWMLDLVATKPFPSNAETELEARLHRETLDFAFSIYDMFVKETTKGLADILGRDDLHTEAMDARIHEMAGALAKVSSEVVREAARTILQAVEQPSFPSAESEDF